MEKRSIEVPFGGFYESVHGYNIGRRYEDENGEITDAMSENHIQDEADYCRLYVARLAKIAGIELEYEETISPREYNFSTDRIFAKVNEADIQKMLSNLDEISMAEYVKRHFTSRDGFMSFYSGDWSDWKNEPLDHNQLGALLHVHLDGIDPDWEEDLTEYMSGNF
jgi:hypothetical protein